MELFGQNPGQIVAQYSYQFESDFMAHMRVCHPNARVSANKVYNEFIKDKDHIHMNSTRWLSLSGFVQYLAKKGLVKIEQSPKGWFMQLIRKDDEHDLKRNKRRDRDAAEKLDDVRQMKEIEKQIKKAATQTEDAAEHEAPTELAREETDAPISFSVQKELPVDHPEPDSKRPKLDLFGDDQQTEHREQSDKAKKHREPSKLEMIHAGFKDKDKRVSSSWIKPGIVVKVLSSALRIHGYYKQKGVIKRIVDRYMAEIEMLNSKDVIRVDQAELETVLPAVGGRLLILKGSHEDCIAELTGIDVDRFSVQVKLLMGPEQGIKEWYEYEDVSKLYNQQLCS